MLLLVAVVVGALIASGLPGAIADAASGMVDEIAGGNETRARPPAAGGYQPGRRGQPARGRRCGRRDHSTGAAATALATCISSGKAYGYYLKAFDPALLRRDAPVEGARAHRRGHQGDPRSGLDARDPGFQALVDARTQAVNEYLATKPTANSKVLRALNNTKKLLDPRFKDAEEVNKALQALRKRPRSCPRRGPTPPRAPPDPGRREQVPEGAEQVRQGPRHRRHRHRPLQQRQQRGRGQGPDRDPRPASASGTVSARRRPRAARRSPSPASAPSPRRRGAGRRHRRQRDRLARGRLGLRPRSRRPARRSTTSPPGPRTRWRRVRQGDGRRGKMVGALEPVRVTRGDGMSLYGASLIFALLFLGGIYVAVAKVWRGESGLDGNRPPEWWFLGPRPGAASRAPTSRRCRSRSWSSPGRCSPSSAGARTPAWPSPWLRSRRARSSTRASSCSAASRALVPRLRDEPGALAERQRAERLAR